MLKNGYSTANKTSNIFGHVSLQNCPSGLLKQTPTLYTTTKSKFVMFSNTGESNSHQFTSEIGVKEACIFNYD